jgi:hypothetical protein
VPEQLPCIARLRQLHVANCRRWPTLASVLRLAAVGTGIAALVGVVHAVCFAGLLLRQRWPRLLRATLAFGWAVLLGLQVAEHLAPGTSSDTTGMLFAIGLLMLLVVFGCYLASSGKVRSFLSH